MQTGSFSQAGWSNRELVERGQKSATAKHVSAKWTRYLRQQQRRRLVGGPGSSRLHLGGHSPADGWFAPDRPESRRRTHPSDCRY